MSRLVFIGSHLGYPMDRTPLGGGAMVGLQLIRHWPENLALTVLGSGPLAPRPGLDYHRLAGGTKPLVSLSELEYARFCRGFERETTSWLLDRRDRFDPARTVVLVNDISEGPDLAALDRAGYPIVSLWHVDVVDYFNRMYLKELLSSESLVRLYRGARSFPMPDLLRVVFEKQERTVALSRRMIVPSEAMAETVARCYGDAAAARTVVVPWGAWSVPSDVAEAERLVAGLRERYRLGPDTTVILTVSRISPEKGLHDLLSALRRLERKGALAGRDVCLLLCGEAAFMQGAAYFRKVRKEAARLKAVRVFFPGYLSDAQKKAHYAVSQLFVSASRHDSYGLNIVEAMREGLPVLACDHYGARQIFGEAPGCFGRLVSGRRPVEGLATALDALLSDRAALARQGEQARRVAAGMRFETAAVRVLETARKCLAEPVPTGAR